MNAMQDIRPENTVRASLRQMSAELAGESVVLNFDDGMYYSLNPIGARIWELIQDPHKVSDLLATIVSEYDVDTARCEADVIALLAEMRGMRLVEVQDAAGP
tara:strand:- start:409 stop:714 length:306 start_codon:yes stop_codon:yes gene_type:complete